MSRFFSFIAALVTADVAMMFIMWDFWWFQSPDITPISRAAFLIILIVAYAYDRWKVDT